MQAEARLRLMTILMKKSRLLLEVRLLWQQMLQAMRQTLIPLSVSMRTFLSIRKENLKKYLNPIKQKMIRTPQRIKQKQPLPKKTAPMQRLKKRKVHLPRVPKTAKKDVIRPLRKNNKQITVMLRIKPMQTVRHNMTEIQKLPMPKMPLQMRLSIKIR